MINSKLILALVVLIIAGAIFYLEGMKAQPEEIIQVITPTTHDNITNSSELVNSFIPSKVYVPDEETLSQKKYTLAPEFKGIGGYINSAAFTLEELRGKVVLVDFWTYSCINCIRTQPYLNAWYEEYSDKGLVIIGVHTPEFEFEKEYENVLTAVKDAEIKYPVVQDNNKETWREFRNRYWPRKYIIDIDGQIRYDHIGEGAYEDTENVIMALLEERNEKLGMEIEIGKSKANPVDVDFGRIETPEMYFGYVFDRGHLGNKEGLIAEETTNYTLPETLEFNKAYLEGSWLVKPDYSELISENGSIVLAYSAKKVNIVASSDQATQLEITLDNEHLSTSLVSEEKLYTIIDDEYGLHTLYIKANKPGFRIYTFTFG